MTRRSLALRRDDGSSALRPDVAGYIDFSGESGAYISTPRTALAAVSTVEVAVLVKLDALGITHSLFAWNFATSGTRLSIGTSNVLNLAIGGVGPVTIGGAASSVAIPSAVTTQPVWLRSKITISSALCEYSYSLDTTSGYDQIAWTAIGTNVTGTNAGVAVLLSASDQVRIGGHGTGVSATSGNIYAFYELINGIKTSWFVNSDVPDPPATSFTSAGGGQVWSLSAGLPPSMFVPSQSFQGGLRSDFSFDATTTGLGSDVLLGVVDVDYTTVRVSYQPALIPQNPTLGPFREAMVVRSTAGFPATNIDGAMLMRHFNTDPVLSHGFASVLDNGLAPQSWYYYSLFARYDDTSGWFKIGEQAWLNPGEFGYGDRLYQGFPDYYRRVDSGGWSNRGMLQRLCDVVGYEFDAHRTWAATVGDVWDFDKLSAKLIPEAGAALGLPQEVANGDRRLRTLVGNAMALRKQKGTRDGTEGYVGALTSYPTRVYEGMNLILRSQHAEWANSFTAQDGSADPATDNHPGWTSKYGITVYGQLSRQTAASSEGTSVGLPDGSFYLRLTNNTGAGSVMGLAYGNGGYAPHVFIPVIPGHQYKFSTLIKASVTTNFNVQVDWFDDKVVQIGSSVTVALASSVGTTWVRAVTALVNAPNGPSSQAKYVKVWVLPTTTMVANAHLNIAKPMFVDLAWRPEGIPSLANTQPLSLAGTGDGTYVYQNFYEPPREVKVNVYPNRTNLALNSNFALNDLPAGAWSTFDAPTYGQLPVAYDNYADIIDAAPDWETSYADMASGLYPLTGVPPTLIWDTAGGRLHINRTVAPFGWTLMHTYFPATDLGGMSAAIGAYSSVAQDGPAYLVPTVGTVTTSDPGPLPNQCTFVYKVRGPTSADYNIVASQGDTSGQYGWSLVRRTNLNSQWNFYPGGTDPSSTYAVNAVWDVNPSDDYIAVSMTQNNGSGRHLGRCWRSTDGVTWTPQSGGMIDIGASVTQFDSNQVVRIGAYRTNQLPFNGRIYSVELRTGLDPTAGTVLWRFDANEYPGGTSYTDPRGQTWTLSTPGAIGGKATKLTLGFEWYSAINVVVPDANGLPSRNMSPEYTLTTSEQRCELVNVQPPANALYGRLLVMVSNIIPNDTSLSWALIEDAPYPESYFDGTSNDGEDGDFFFAVGKSYTGGNYLSPSVYYMRFRRFASGQAGADALTSLMPYLLPFRRPFKVVTAATGLYNVPT